MFNIIIIASQLNFSFYKVVKFSLIKHAAFTQSNM